LKQYFVEGDSSSVMVRAVSSAFRNEIIEPIKINPLLKPIAKIANMLSQSRKINLIEKSVQNIGIPESMISEINSEVASNWVINQYKFSSDKKVDSIFIGAPSGGATHLAALYRAPFLTQHFLVGVKQPKDADDINTTLEGGVRFSKKLLENDENIEIIIHYDPVHDRFMIKHINTIRFKLKKLTESYKQFIKKHLRSQGNIIFFDVKYMWKQYKIEDNIFFQVGGLGELLPFEYIMGSDRIVEWLTRIGSSKRDGWNLEGYPLEDKPESEWGTIDGLKEDVMNFALENGYSFIEIHATHPEKVSELAMLTFIYHLEHIGKEIKQVYFDCFTAINPTFNINTSTPPIWLPFNCGDSHTFARRILEKHKALFVKYKPKILFTGVPGYTQTPDLVSFHDWELLFSQYGDFEAVGISRKHYPMDLSYVVNYPSALKNLMKKMYDPVTEVPSIFDIQRVHKEYYLDLEIKHHSA